MPVETKMRSQIKKGVLNMISSRKGHRKTRIAEPLLKYSFLTALRLVPTTLHDVPSPSHNRGVAFSGGESAGYVPQRLAHWYEDFCTVAAHSEAESMAQSTVKAIRKTAKRTTTRKKELVRGQKDTGVKQAAVRSKPAAVRNKLAAVQSKPAAVRSKARGTRLPKESRRSAVTEQFQVGFPTTSPGGFYAIPKSWPDVRRICSGGMGPSGMGAGGMGAGGMGCMASVWQPRCIASSGMLSCTLPGVTSLSPWLGNTIKDEVVATVAEQAPRAKRERKKRATKISAHTIIRHNGIMIGYMKNAYEPTNMVATAVAPSKPREEVFVDIMYAQLGNAEPFRAQTPGMLNIPPKVQQIFDSRFALPLPPPFAAAPVDLGGLVLSTYIPEAHVEVKKERKPRTAKTSKTVTEMIAPGESTKKRAAMSTGKVPSVIEQSIQSVKAKTRTAKKTSENISLQEQLTHLANLQKRAAKRMNEDTSRKEQIVNLVRAKKRAAKRAAEELLSREQMTPFIDLASGTSVSGESEVSYLLQRSLSHLNGGGRSPYSQSQSALHGRYAFSQSQSSPHSLAGFRQSQSSPHSLAEFSQSQSSPHSLAGFSQSQSIPDSQASFSQSQSGSNCSGGNPEQERLSREQAYRPYGAYPQMAGGHAGGAGWNEDYGAQRQQRQWMADQKPPWVDAPSAQSPQLGRRQRAQSTPVHGYYKQQAGSQMAQAGSQMAQFSNLLKWDPDTLNKAGINPSAIMNQHARDFQQRFNQSQAEYTSRLRKNHDIFNALSSECALVLDQRHDASCQQRDASSQQRNVLCQQRDVLCQRSNVPRQQPNILCQQRDALSQQPNILSQQPNILYQQRDVLSQQPNVLCQQPNVLYQQRNVPCLQQDVLCQQRGVLSQQPNVLCQQPDVLYQQHDIPCQQQDILCQPQDVSCQQRDVSCHQPDVLYQQCDILCQQQDVSCQQQDVSCQQQDVLSQQPDVLCQQRNVQCLQGDVLCLAQQYQPIDDVGRQRSTFSVAKSPTKRIIAEGE